MSSKATEPSNPFPSFSSLPLDRAGPPGNAWGLFPLKDFSSSTLTAGPSSSAEKPTKQDQLGTLNLLTPSNTLAATKEIEYGIRICTDWELTKPAHPCFGRRVFEHRIVNKAPRIVNDDVVEFNTQSGSQWDGFRHFGNQAHGVFYNGCTQHDIENSSRNGIHVWVENGGVVGRGVLLDYPRYAAANNIQYNPLITHRITTAELDAIIAFQKLPPFKVGDIFFLYTGFLDALEALEDDKARAYAEVQPPPAIGLDASTTTLEWFWEKHFAAVASNAPAFEALPFKAPGEVWLHEYFLTGWGMPIGEFFDLRKLSNVCAEKKKWTFLYSSVPLNVPGGVASPPNGVAIL